MKKLAITIIALLLAFAAHAQDWRQRGYEADVDRVNARLESGAITPLQAAREKLKSAQRYYPQDDMLLVTRELIVDKAEQHEAGQISRAELDEQQAQIWARYMRERDELTAREQEALARQRRAAFIGGAMMGAGRSLQQANPAPVECQTINMGGSLRTTCR